MFHHPTLQFSLNFPSPSMLEGGYLAASGGDILTVFTLRRGESWFNSVMLIKNKFHSIALSAVNTSP